MPLSQPQIPPLTISPLIPSSHFYLAAGTVTIDPSCRKILILYDRHDSSYKLPRGHTDWGESPSASALRETFEETGFGAALLPVCLQTRATVPSSALVDPSHPYHEAAKTARWDDSGDLVVARLTEPFALMQHYQPDGSLAVVFWYVAVADSEVLQATETQGVEEDYEALWVGWAGAEEMMVNSVCE
jgi:8-oxo-dGTP pyrophosphatase MutT (NUDIX family)